MGIRFKIIILLAILSIVYFFAPSIFANTVPEFPSCNPKIFEANGDWAHYDFGSHEILGIGRRDGRDDVYSLSDGNFLQCFCPVEGGEGLPAQAGIQTNWWNAERAGLTNEEIQSFINSGWSKEDGGNWNLYAETYLGKNVDFSCAQVIPTETLTPSPSPIPSSPLSQGGSAASAPVCWAPAVTKAPLYSSANLSRIDADSIKITWIVTDGHAQKYGIFYGTNPNDLKWYTEVFGHEQKEAVINSVPQGNIYFKVCSIGTCGDAVCGGDIPTVLGATTELPSTGGVAIVLLGFAPIGYYFYKRFRLL